MVSKVTAGAARTVPKALAARYESALADPDLISARRDMALLEARLAELLEDAYREAEDGAPPKTALFWRDILETLEQQRKLRVAELERLKAAEKSITVERAMAIVASISNLITENVTDKQVLAAIYNGINRLLYADHPAALGLARLPGPNAPTDPDAEL